MRKQIGTATGVVVESLPLTDIHPAPWNVRTGHDIDGIVESIRINGFRDPIEVWGDTGEIVAGEGRYHAAKVLGMETVPVIRHTFDSLASAKRYAIANNRLTDKSAFDLPALAAQLNDLPDLDGTGFSASDLAALTNATGGRDLLTADDDVPELPVEPITQSGDLWVMGDHRLLCGDATSADDLARLLDGVTPLLCVTDPPYGVNYDPAWRARASDEGKLSYAARRVGVVTNDDRVDWGEVWSRLNTDVLYCWSESSCLMIDTGGSIRDAGYELRNVIIWSKPHFPIGRGHYHWRHEMCWYAVRAGATAHWCGDRKQTTVWDCALDRNVEGGHSTQKPVELMLRSLRNHDAPLVIDPFLGSGTTLIAAEKLDRKCYAMEIEPAYVDVAVRRWCRATGNTAVRESDGNEWKE